MRFIFKQENRTNWPKIIHNLHTVIADKQKGDYEVELKPLNLKRSGGQLRAYWVLIESVKRWMNEQGNTYSRETVSDYFKIKAGHSEEIDGIVTPKSIANKSSCTRLEMEGIINEILQFGADPDHNIVDCKIEPLELSNLLEFYQTK